MKMFPMLFFSKLKLGKFLIHDSLLIYEDPTTGVLRSVHLETKQVTLFNAHCVKEEILPYTVWGLCYGSNNTLLHAWGGNLRIYSLDFEKNKKNPITKYSKAYLSKARATLIHDEDDTGDQEEDQFQLFCEHQGFYYCTDHSTLNRICPKSGKRESINLNFNIVCMFSCTTSKLLFVCSNQGLLYKIDDSITSFCPLISCISSATFVRPRQILSHQSLLYVLDCRGLWILSPTLKKFLSIPFVLHFALSCLNTEKIKIICREFNNVFCIS